ncbi:MAG TPA: nucleotidyl transferase AbiEii/AbiGii toxin family protein [Pseudonocardiaceae bacterium]
MTSSNRRDEHRARTPPALLAALNNRLRAEAAARGIDVNRLRRHVAFERLLIRLAADNTDGRSRWVLKGGLALELRLQNQCRTTKDLDLALADVINDGDVVRDELIEAFDKDPGGDYFSFTVGGSKQIAATQGGVPGWRFPVVVGLAGKTFVSVHLDVVPRMKEIDGVVEPLTFRSALAFAGYPPSVTVPAIDVNQHAAEKFHALTRDYGDRPNTRVKDLVDLVLLIEHGLIDPARVASRVTSVFLERNSHAIPARLPEWPASWNDDYASLIADLEVSATSLPVATTLVASFWKNCIVQADQGVVVPK